MSIFINILSKILASSSILNYIRVGNNCGGYFKYTGNAAPLDAANGQWKLIKVPLAGGGSPYSYSKSQIGDVSLSEINYVSVHADTWDFGFGIWLDGVHFTNFGVGEQEQFVQDLEVNIYPNPVIDMVNIHIEGTVEVVELEFFNAVGEMVYGTKHFPGDRSVNISHLPAGIYYLKVICGKLHKVEKIVKF